MTLTLACKNTGKVYTIRSLRHQHHEYSEHDFAPTSTDHPRPQGATNGSLVAANDGLLGPTSHAGSSFGLVVATYHYQAVEEDEINLNPGDILRADGLGEDHGWLTAMDPKHHGGRYGEGRGVIPSTHIRPLNRCTVQATHDYTAQSDDELSFKNTDMIDLVCHSEDAGWLIGIIGSQVGLVPETHLAGVQEAIAKLPPAAAPPASQYRPQAATLPQLPSTNPYPQAEAQSPRVLPTSQLAAQSSPRLDQTSPWVPSPGTCVKCGAQFVKGQVFCGSCREQL